MIFIHLMLIASLMADVCSQTLQANNFESLVKLPNKEVEYCGDSENQFRAKSCSDIDDRPRLCVKKWIAFLCPNYCDPDKSKSVSRTKPDCCKDFEGEFPFQKDNRKCADFTVIDDLKQYCEKKKWLQDLCPLSCGTCKEAQSIRTKIVKKEEPHIGIINNDTFESTNQPLKAKLNLFGPKAVQKYSNCDDFTSDLRNAASIIVNQVISRYSRTYERVIKHSSMGPPEMVAGEARTADAFDSSSVEGEDSFGTNVQVEGIDQADIVKSTDTTVFAAYGDKLVVWDAQTLDILSVTTIPSEKKLNRGLLSIPYYSYHQKPTIKGLLLYRDRLAVIVSPNQWYHPYWYFGFPKNRPIFDNKTTMLYLYDVSSIPQDATGELELVSKKRILGNFKEARLIDNTAHVVTSANIGDSFYQMTRELNPYFRPDLFANQTISDYISNASKFANETLIPGFVEKFMNETAFIDSSCKNIHQISLFQKYIGQQPLKVFQMPTSIIGGLIQVNKFNMEWIGEELDSLATSLFLPNAYQTEVYASHDKLILATRGQEIPSNDTRAIEATFIQALSLHSSNNEIMTSYGVVTGYVLNKYSMDLWDGHLRLATTKSAVWGCAERLELREIDTDVIFPFRRSCTWEIISDSDNFMYVLRFPSDPTNHMMTQVGYLNNLGKAGEQIYSVRFMRNKAFVVTFLLTDPFYTIDLSKHDDPREVGALEISGFANYLHPYDIEGDLIIGVGQDADEKGRVTGLQISLFNTTKLSNATLVQRYSIEEERGFDGQNVWSTSDAQYQPEAFRFLSKSKKLILPASIRGNINVTDKFDGFMVFDLDLDKIAYSFNISHGSERLYQFESSCWHYPYMSSRSLVHKGVLTTMKGYTVLTHDLEAPHELKKSLDLNKLICKPSD